MTSYLYSVEASPSDEIARRLGAAEVAPGLVEGIMEADSEPQARLKIFIRLPRGGYPQIVTIEGTVDT